MYKKILLGIVLSVSLLVLVQGTKSMFSNSEAMGGNSISTAAVFPSNEVQTESVPQNTEIQQAPETQIIEEEILPEVETPISFAVNE